MESLNSNRAGTIAIMAILLSLLFSCQRTSVQPAPGRTDTVATNPPPVAPSSLDLSYLPGWWGRYQGGSLNTPANPGYFRLYFGKDSFYLQDGLGGSWFTTHDTIHIDTIFSSQVKIKTIAGDTILTLSYGTYSQTYVRIDSLPVISPWVITIAGGGHFSNSGGDGGMAIAAYINEPQHVGVDGAGNVYIADREFVVWKVSSLSGIINRVAGMNFDQRYAGDGGPATSAAIDVAAGMTVDPSGNIYISDKDRNCIRKISAADGKINLFAGNPNAAPGYAGDGGPASVALLSAPTLISLDGGGNIYFCDLGNNRIRKINAADGTISTVAGNGSAGAGGDGGDATAAQLTIAAMTVDAAGNLFVTDGASIRKVAASDGKIQSIAGFHTPGSKEEGITATDADLFFIQGIAVDPSGNIYLSQATTERIRKISAADDKVYTVAGNGVGGYTGDGKHATGFMVNNPKGIVCDAAGNIYFADTDNNRVRRIAAK